MKRFGAVIVAFACCLPTAAAHVQLSSHVQHRCTLRVDAANIDVEVELTFLGNRALVERRRIDADRNGVITPRDLDAYLAGSRDAWTRALGLRIDGSSVALHPLYEPRCDLMECNRTIGSPLTLRMVYFARRPDGLVPGSTIVVEDGLWADQPAVCTLDIDRTPRMRIAADRATSPFSAPAPDAAPRRLKARCLQLPSPPVAHQSVDGAAEIRRPADLATGASSGSIMRVGPWAGVLAIVTLAFIGLHRIRSQHREQETVNDPSVESA